MFAYIRGNNGEVLKNVILCCRSLFSGSASVSCKNFTLVIAYRSLQQNFWHYSSTSICHKSPSGLSSVDLAEYRQNVLNASARTRRQNAVFWRHQPECSALGCCRANGHPSVGSKFSVRANTSNGTPVVVNFTDGAASQ